MDNHVTFSCFIIGTGSLPLQCGQLLVGQGHEIRGVITSDVELQRWATAHDIPHFDSSTSLSAILSQQPFDYLFSIFNVNLLRPEHLKLPSRMTINCHDGPLPKYAGLYATSWALLNYKPQHGVTWHVVTERIDAGEILSQKFIPVSEHDTTFSLNLKCYEAAIQSFAELVP